MLDAVGIERFLSYLEHNRNFSILTISTYRQALYEAASFVQYDEMDGKTVCDMTPYRLHIAGQKKNTVAKKVSALRSYFEFLTDEGLVFKLKGTTQVKRTRTLPKPVPTTVVKEALALCDDEERLIVMLLYGLGLRISELCAVELGHVGSGWIRVRGKGNKSRDLPLAEAVAKLLELYVLKFSPSTFLLEHDGAGLSQNQLRYKITKIFQKVGRKVTAHQLRHSFATDLLNGGARINDVSSLLGHEHLSATKIYTKLSSSLKFQNYLKAHPLCTDEASASR